MLCWRMTIRRRGGACGLSQSSAARLEMCRRVSPCARSSGEDNAMARDGKGDGDQPRTLCSRVVGRKVEAGEHRAGLGHSACTSLEAQCEYR